MLNSGLKDLRDHFETLFRECERSVGFACPGVDHGRIKDDSEIAMHNFKGTGFIDMPHLLMWAYNMSLYWKATHQNENRPRGFVTTANNLITTKYFFVQDMFSSEQHHWLTPPFWLKFLLWTKNYRIHWQWGSVCQNSGFIFQNIFKNAQWEFTKAAFRLYQKVCYDTLTD